MLYIEDNEANKMLVHRILEAKGFHILHAEDGQTGFEIARREMPDLILMDISLPGMDGLEATGLIKNTEAVAHIPVIALTANAMKGDAEKCLAAGCDAYLQKPIGVKELLNLVYQYIDQ
ncbi:MAG: response regulator [Anaerolineae bacterium]